MRRNTAIATSLFLLAFAGPVFGSDFRGVMTALIALPGLALACALYFIFALIPGPGRVAFALESVAVVAIFVAAAFFWGDAKSQLGTGHSGIAYAFFALLGVLLVLYLCVTWRFLSREFPDDETSTGDP